MRLVVGKRRELGEVGILQLAAIFLVAFAVRDMVDWFLRGWLGMGSTLTWILAYLTWGLVAFAGHLLVSHYNKKRAEKMRAMDGGPAGE